MNRKKFEKKEIALQPDDKEWLDKKAQELGMSTNQLIRIIIKQYIMKGN